MIQSTDSAQTCEVTNPAINRPGDALPPLEKTTYVDVLLLAGIFAAMSWGLGSYGLYEPHEGHFAGVGREMVTRGDWIVPHLNGAPYLNKPPLLYWMVALSYTIFNTVNEWTARLPLLLIGWSGVLLVWHWTRQLWGLRAARIAAGMLTASAGWYLFCHQLMIDPLLSVEFLACSYLFWRITLNPENRNRWIAFYGAIALSVLAKGIIGMLPLGIVVLFALVRKDFTILRRSRPLLGIAILLLLVGPWVYMLEHRVSGALHYMIVNEHLKRIVDTRWPPDYSVVKVSAPGYVLIALIWMFPWSLCLPQTLSFSIKKARTGLLQETPKPIADAFLILLISVLLPIIVFLPMPSRLIYYCLPSLLPFVVLSAGWWSGISNACYTKGRIAAGTAFTAVGIAIFSAGFFIVQKVERVPQLMAVRSELGSIRDLMIILGAGLLGGGVLLLIRRIYLSAALVCALMIAAEVHNMDGFSKFDDIWASKNMVEKIRPVIGDDAVWVSEGSKEIGASAGIAYYLGVDESGRARNVYVMKDDTRRPPPKFPGAPAAYLLDHQQLTELWGSDRPVLFVTDFLRTDWLRDYPWLPTVEPALLPVDGSGNRRVYANEAAAQRYFAAAISPQK